MDVEWDLEQFSNATPLGLALAVTAKNSLVNRDINCFVIKISKYNAAYQCLKTVESHIGLPCDARPSCCQEPQDQAAAAKDLRALPAFWLRPLACKPSYKRSYSFMGKPDITSSEPATSESCLA